MREKCPYWELFSPNAGENIDQNNFEYEHFLRSVGLIPL